MKQSIFFKESSVRDEYPIAVAAGLTTYAAGLGYVSQLTDKAGCLELLILAYAAARFALVSLVGNSISFSIIS